jgi:hypothetical protein
LLPNEGIEKIAIEVKSFRSASDMKDLEDAVGQFVLYDHLLTRYDPERVLYLAVPEAVRASIFEEEAGAVLIEDRVIRLFTFSPPRRLSFNGCPKPQAKTGRFEGLARLHRLFGQ